MKWINVKDRLPNLETRVLVINKDGGLSPQQGDSPLSKANAFANGLTEDLKKQLQKEMFEARNQI